MQGGAANVRPPFCYPVMAGTAERSRSVPTPTSDGLVLDAVLPTRPTALGSQVGLEL